MGKDSAARIELAGHSTRWEQLMKRSVKVIYFVPLWDGTIMRCSFAERKLLEGT